MGNQSSRVVTAVPRSSTALTILWRTSSGSGDSSPTVPTASRSVLLIMKATEPLYNDIFESDIIDSFIHSDQVLHNFDVMSLFANMWCAEEHKKLVNRTVVDCYWARLVARGE